MAVDEAVADTCTCVAVPPGRTCALTPEAENSACEKLVSRVPVIVRVRVSPCSIDDGVTEMTEGDAPTETVPLGTRYGIPRRPQVTLALMSPAGTSTAFC